jgi:hypothetical protein
MLLRSARLPMGGRVLASGRLAPRGGMSYDPTRGPQVAEENLRIAQKEIDMHALVVRVIIHNADRTREVLNSQVVPQVSGAPGFKSGYWTWSSGGGELNGLSMIIFDSAENARAAGDRISAVAANAPDDVTLDSVEVREVVASA